MPLGDKIHFLNGFSVSGGPALIDVFSNWEKSGAFVQALGGTAPTSGGWPWQLKPAVEVLHSHQLRGADLTDSARGSADQRFGDPGLASWSVQVAGSPVAQTAPTKAGKAVEVGEGHGFEIKMQMKKGRDCELSLNCDQAYAPKTLAEISAPTERCY